MAEILKRSDPCMYYIREHYCTKRYDSQFFSVCQTCNKYKKSSGANLERKLSVSAAKYNRWG